MEKASLTEGAERMPRWDAGDELRIKWLRENDAKLTVDERTELRALRYRETVVARGMLRDRARALRPS